MSRFTRLLAVVAPSVPPADRARILAAMEGRDLETPVVSRLGEDRGTTGPATTAPTSLGAGGLSGDGAASERPVPAQAPDGGRHLDPGARPPGSETAADWAPHPSHRYLFTDERLALLLSQWGATS